MATDSNIFRILLYDWIGKCHVYILNAILCEDIYQFLSLIRFQIQSTDMDGLNCPNHFECQFLSALNEMVNFAFMFEKLMHFN